MKASDVLVYKEKNVSNDFLFKDYYINYLLVKFVFSHPVTFEELYNYLSSLYDDKVYVDKQKLYFYVNTNFDVDNNDIIVISDFQIETLNNILSNTYKAFNEDVNVEDIALKMFNSSDDVQNDFLGILREHKDFYSLLLDSFSIYSKGIYDYEKEVYDAVLFDLLSKKNVYLDLIDNILNKLFIYNSNNKMNIKVKTVFHNKKIVKVCKLFGIKTSNDFLNYSSEQLLIIFPFDFKYVIERLGLINNYIYDKFINKTIDFLNDFDDRKKSVFNYRIVKDCATLQELGDILNITRERVRQIEAQEIRMISNLYKTDFYDFFCNLYLLLNERNFDYIYAYKLNDLINDVDIVNVFKSFLKYSRFFKLKYNSIDDIIYDSSKKDYDLIVQEEISVIPEIVNKSDLKGFSPIQINYILNNYNLKKNSVYLKKGMSDSNLYLRIIDSCFPNGYKINNEEDYSYLMEECKKKYNILEGTSLRYVASILDRSDNYCLIDRGKYIRKDKLPKIPSSLLSSIKDYLNNSDYVVYYSVLFDKFNDELMSVGITNQYMLKGILDSELGDDYKTNRDFIMYGNQNTVWDAVLSYMRSFKTSFSIDDLSIEFPDVSYTIMQGIISYENQNGLLNLYNKRFIYANNTNVDDFKQKFEKKINELFKISNSEFLTASKIYAKIYLSSDNFLNSISFTVDDMNIYSVIKYLLPEDYIYRKPLIIKLDSNMKNSYYAVSDYLLALDEFDDKILLRYLNRTGLGQWWYYNFNLLCNYLSDDFVQVDKKKMVKKGKIKLDDFKIKKIEENINNLILRYSEINLDSFNAYFIFPAIENYMWNSYLLIGIINSYLNDRYKVTRENNCNIVRRMNDEL